jgi:hypothetical protein
MRNRFINFILYQYGIGALQDILRPLSTFAKSIVCVQIEDDTYCEYFPN